MTPDRKGDGMARIARAAADTENEQAPATIAHSREQACDVFDGLGT